ncbi:NADH dehydrogenase [ubiquinone] 1 beta subcomplex subunit 3-B [Linum grandiflorum]
MLTNQFRHALPGFGIGVAAFAVYVIGEQIYNRVGAPSSHGASFSASHSH